MSGSWRWVAALLLVCAGSAHAADASSKEPAAPAAPAKFTLESPLDYQVYQRQDFSRGTIRVAGKLDADGEARFRITGKPREGDLPAGWRPLAVDPQTHAFAADVPVPAGGWYRLEVRGTKGGEAARECAVEHVGVGEVFIVAGQSNSSNHGSEKQSPASGMGASFDGAKWVPANDPQPGGSGKGGSFMPAFCDAMHARYAVPIGVVSVGVGATSVRQWLPKGERMTNPPTTGAFVKEIGPGEWECTGQCFDRLMQRVSRLGPHGFRAILWHQGESDAGQARSGYPADRQITGDQYRAFMEKLIRATRERAGWNIPWFVAQATYHSEKDPADEEFRAAQKALWQSGLALEGPDTDALRAEYRAGVHFNGKGLQTHGKLWAEKVAAYMDTPSTRAQIIQSSEKRQEPLAVSTEKLYDETCRPQFHFTPMRNWTNDPNGLVFYKGEYHLFFQHNPKGIKWGNMTWGHAVSTDLVHWRQIENAIEPDALGTIFSGSAVVDRENTAGFQKGDEKTIVAIYTAAGGTSEESKGQPFTQCIAYSTDRGRTFTKYDKNPVLPHVVGRNRDPKVVWHAPTKQWIMALFKDKNTFAFFSSPDLKTWAHLHDMDVPGCGECPDFFEMPVDGNKAVKKWVWTAANGKYLVGSFDGRKFTPEQPLQQADWGKNYYAVQTYSDVPESDGRRIQISWMRGGKYPGMPFNQQMSFPCEMRLRTFPEGLRICRLPLKEIDLLHEKEHAWKNEALRPDTNLLAGLSGDLFDIRAEIEPGDAAEVGLKIRGETVAWTAKDKRLACLGGAAELAPADGRLHLRILVDRTSIEVFGQGGRAAMTSCFLPKPADKSLAVYATGGAAKIVSLQVFTLKSAWPAQ